MFSALWEQTSPSHGTESCSQISSTQTSEDGSLWECNQLLPGGMFEVQLHALKPTSARICFKVDEGFEVGFSAVHRPTSNDAEEVCLLEVSSSAHSGEITLPGQGTCFLQWHNPQGWLWSSAATIKYSTTTQMLGDAEPAETDSHPLMSTLTEARSEWTQKATEPTTEGLALRRGSTTCSLAQGAEELSSAAQAEVIDDTKRMLEQPVSSTSASAKERDDASVDVQAGDGFERLRELEDAKAWEAMQREMAAVDIGAPTTEVIATDAQAQITQQHQNQPAQSSSSIDAQAELLEEEKERTSRQPSSTLRRLLADLDESSGSEDSGNDVEKRHRGLRQRVRSGRLLASSPSASHSSHSSASSSSTPSPRIAEHQPQSSHHIPYAAPKAIGMVIKARPPPGRPPPSYRPHPGRPQQQPPQQMPSASAKRAGKGRPPGPPIKSAGPGKAPGKAPPGKASVPAKPHASPGSNAESKSILPIGRRLSLRPGRADAAAFSNAKVPREADSTGDENASTECEEGMASVQVDFQALRGAFAPQPRNSGKSSLGKQKRKELLPRSIAQNIAIALARLGSSTEELAHALKLLGVTDDQSATHIEALSRSALASAAEGAARLLDVWPEEKILEPLLAYAKENADPSPLRDVEKQLLPLVALPRVRQRLRLMILRGSLSQRVHEAMSQISLLRNACAKIQASALLKDLLAVVVLLFNYVNFGVAPAKPGEQSSSAAQMQGVDVESLLRLRETKAFKGDFAGFNMLHFVIKQLRQNRPSLKLQELEDEFVCVKNVSKVSLERLHDELQEVQADHLFVKGELQDHQTEYGLTLQDSVEEERVSPKAEGTRGFLNRLLGKSLDLANLAEAWLRGDEVVGKPYHPEIAMLAGFESLKPEDGIPPPPGWLWLCRPSGHWQKCWCEVRGPLLLLHRIEGERCVGAVYVVLPGASVRPLKHEQDEVGSSGPSATEAPAAQSTSATAPSSFPMFELFASRGGQAGGGMRLLKLQAANHREANTWSSLLEKAALRPGAGFMTVSLRCTSSVAAFSPKKMFCTAFSSELVAFARPRDALEGEPPVRTWPMIGSSSFCVVDVYGDDHSFELHRMGWRDQDDMEMWRFSCSSYEDKLSWLRQLGSSCSTSANADPHDSKCVVDSPEGRNVTSEEEPTDTEGETDESEPEVDCKGNQLLQLRALLARHTLRWEQALQGAETDCHGLLRFFGREAEPGRKPSRAAQQVFEALVAFTGQLRSAWEDLEKHDRASKSGQRPSFRKTASKEPQQTPDAAEGKGCQAKPRAASHDVDMATDPDKEQMRQLERLMRLGTPQHYTSGT
eukprot:TRINITY_DN89723_c0_g1_i1.p1 TRINITY_DN89723_c0_g1~~TRINITY_DN89723_c0_g1_i1.p1  ORF type:complete len:1316 (+),score=204.78 TRINITY_DN89723_c0_g1_i1:118-4065(+)